MLTVAALDEMSWDEVEAKRISNEEEIAGQMGWKYYLPEAAQNKEVRQQLDEIQKQSEYKDGRDIKVIDPCMGSGHILVYAFDVLMQMYESDGYSQRDAAQCILENNLYGLDIDKTGGAARLLCRDDEGPPVRPAHFHSRHPAPCLCDCREQRH